MVDLFHVKIVGPNAIALISVELGQYKGSVPLLIYRVSSGLVVAVKVRKEMVRFHASFSTSAFNCPL